MKIKSVLALFILVLVLGVFSSCADREQGNNSSQTAQPESSEAAVSDIENALADELVLALKEKYATNISLYYVKDTTANFLGYKPLADFKRYGKLKAFREITGEEQIESFRNNLEISKWKKKNIPLKFMPEMIVYFGTNIHINLEAKYQGECYISINSPEGRAFYLVPQNVYDYVLSYYN